MHRSIVLAAFLLALALATLTAGHAGRSAATWPRYDDPPHFAVQRLDGALLTTWIVGPTKHALADEQWLLVGDVEVHRVAGEPLAVTVPLPVSYQAGEIFTFCRRFASLVSCHSSRPWPAGTVFVPTLRQ
jgi:hypothetical protein